MATLTEKLDELYTLRSYITVLQADAEELVENQIPEDVRKAIATIRADFAAQIEIEQAAAAKLQDEIEAEVLGCSESVKGRYLHAVYTKGRTTWDGELLKGYAVAHPEILALQKTGNPSVSIRPITGSAR